MKNPLFFPRFGPRNPKKSRIHLLAGVITRLNNPQPINGAFSKEGKVHTLHLCEMWSHGACLGGPIYS